MGYSCSCRNTSQSVGIAGGQSTGQSAPLDEPIQAAEKASGMSVYLPMRGQFFRKSGLAVCCKIFLRIRLRVRGQLRPSLQFRVLGLGTRVRIRSASASKRGFPNTHARTATIKVLKIGSRVFVTTAPNKAFAAAALSLSKTPPQSDEIEKK
jgi:hypothetical protein